MRPKPKTLLEIKPAPKVDLFRRRQKRVNLSYFPKKRFLYHPVKIAGVILVVSIFIGSSALAPVGGGTLAIADVNQDRASLEAELKRLEGQIQEYQSTINDYRRQGSTLKGEIGILETKIKKINLQIRAINLALQRLDSNIQQTTTKIGKVEADIDFNQAALADLIRKIDENDKKGMIEILLENPELSDFFSSVNDVLLVQNSVKTAIEKLTDLRSQLITQKEVLAMEKEDAEALKDYQVKQKQDADSARIEKDQLLKTTKGKESEYQKLLVQTQKTAAQIRSRIFELLGGGQLTFEQAYKFASFAEKATGIRAALILAVLDRESALGRNVGKCSYKTAMAPGPPLSSRDDVTPFLTITSELGLNPEATLVSCPNADGAYGGAMGPAQFLPTTWLKYRGQVAGLTGSNPASPWRNLDAFVAAALFLKNAGAAGDELGAAARYYCGSNWQRYVCTSVYGQNVVQNAQRFEQDIKILNG